MLYLLFDFPVRLCSSPSVPCLPLRFPGAEGPGRPAGLPSRSCPRRRRAAPPPLAGSPAAGPAGLRFARPPHGALWLRVASRTQRRLARQAFLAASSTLQKSPGKSSLFSVSGTTALLLRRYSPVEGTLTPAQGLSRPRPTRGSRPGSGDTTPQALRGYDRGP